MGKIVVSENITLDGVVQDPIGDEGFRLGGWFNAISDRDREAWGQVLFEEAQRAEAMLLGRRSDAWFAPRWAQRTGAWADRLNALPKYVVSSTGAAPQWTQRHGARGRGDRGGGRAEGAAGRRDRRQRQRPARAHAAASTAWSTSCGCWSSRPCSGSGERLYGEATATLALRLRESRTVGDGIAYLAYDAA